MEDLRKAILNAMADSDELPEGVRLNAKVLIKLKEIIDKLYALTERNIHHHEYSEKDLKELRKTVEYLEMVDYGIESFFASLETFH